MVSDELEILKIVVSRLEGAEIRYIVSGSIAGNFYSEPRMTRDIDIVVELSMSKVEAVYNLFKDDFYIDRDSIVAAVKSKQMFNIIHNEKVIKIDFIIAQGTLYEKMKFKRRIEKDIEGIKVFVISPEDLILSKLIWVKDSRSEMQFKDIKNIILFNKDVLDFNYLRDWAVKLSVSDMFEECLNAVGHR